MNYDIIETLNLKYELIDKEKSFSFYNEKGIRIVELFLLDQNPRICPRCNESKVYIISSIINTIKHASIAENKILVNNHRRVYKGEYCGHVYVQSSPIVEENRHISIEKDMLILHDLRDSTNTFKKLAEKYDVSPTYISNLFDKKVDIKRGVLPQVLCIDEIYSKKLSKYHYLCVLYSPQRKAIIDILESKRKDFLIDFL